LQKKANDPNRFSNRGGALLKEAKEKVKVQKMLPKVRLDLTPQHVPLITLFGSWREKKKMYIFFVFKVGLLYMLV
jgi:hypothetical protein